MSSLPAGTPQPPELFLHQHWGLGAVALPQPSHSSEALSSLLCSGGFAHMFSPCFCSNPGPVLSPLCAGEGAMLGAAAPAPQPLGSSLGLWWSRGTGNAGTGWHVEKPPPLLPGRAINWEMGVGGTWQLHSPCCEQGFGSVQPRCLEWGCKYTNAGVLSLKGQVQRDCSVS